MAADEPPGRQPVLLTPAEVVRLLHLDAQDLKRMRDEGRGPSFHHLGNGLVRYNSRDVQQWRQSGSGRAD